eukprot:763072-Hanusia_phi.AAC.1
MDHRRDEPALHVCAGEGLGEDSGAAEAHLRDTGEEERGGGEKSGDDGGEGAGAAGGDAWDQEAAAQGVRELPEHLMRVGGRRSEGGGETYRSTEVGREEGRRCKEGRWRTRSRSEGEGEGRSGGGGGGARQISWQTSISSSLYVSCSLPCPSPHGWAVLCTLETPGPGEAGLEDRQEARIDSASRRQGLGPPRIQVA